jgi:hypothetical protein
MDDQERLLRMTEDLGAPIQVSGTDGATRIQAPGAARRVAERVEEARLESAASAEGSCGMSWSGWGN